MVRIIGKTNCVNCEITKQTLKKKGIEFTYELFDELTDDEQLKLTEESKLKGIMKMPLILKDDTLTTLVEL